MPINCVIFYDNPAKVFYSGQLLGGRVELSLTDSQKVRGIYVEISGDAYCHWTEGSKSSKRSYTGEDCYLKERSYFVGGHGEEDKEIPPGQYQYNFQCNLPAGLPTSVDGQIGHIRYRVRVVLDIPRWPDKEFLDQFTVIKPLNLNDDPTLRLPASMEVSKTFLPYSLCICCPSGPLHLVARVPASGYTPGETINVEIDVDNKSKLTAGIRVQLIKTITFHIYANSDKHREETVRVGEKPSIGISRSKTVETFRTDMVVLPTLPTDISSDICQVRYALKITAVLSCFHINPFVNVPITIGSYPLLGNTNPPTEKNINTKFAPPVMQTLYPAVPSAPALSYELQQPLLLPQNEKEPFPPIPAGQYLPPGQPEPEPYAGEAVASQGPITRSLHWLAKAPERINKQTRKLGFTI